MHMTYQKWLNKAFPMGKLFHKPIRVLWRSLQACRLTRWIQLIKSTQISKGHLTSAFKGKKVSRDKSEELCMAKQWLKDKKIQIRIKSLFHCGWKSLTESHRLMLEPVLSNIFPYWLKKADYWSSNVCWWHYSASSREVDVPELQ